MSSVPNPVPGETLDEFIDRVLPQVLPDNAIRVAIHKDGQDRQYLTLYNNPTAPYVANRIHDGYEFAIGGDKDIILRTLNNKLNSFPRQNWHIVAIPESNVQASNAPRWPSRSSVHGGPIQQNPNNSGGVTRGGPVIAAPWTNNFQDANVQPNSPFDQGTSNHQIKGYNVGVAVSPSGQNQPDHAPQPPKKHVHHFTHQDAKLLRSFEQFQRKQDAISAVLNADEEMGDYTGTNLCRWCGREGHEAIDCIKFDPEHLDKLVCVACNNKKHVIDECEKFTKVMSVEQQAALLLDAGAGKPGVRSFFYPWVSLRSAVSHLPPSYDTLNLLTCPFSSNGLESIMETEC